MILITSASEGTIDRDVEKMASAVKYVSEKFGKKMHAEFEVTVIKDISNMYKDKQDPCDHKFSFCTPEGECIDIDNSSHIPMNSILACVKCGMEYEFFGNVEDLKNSFPELKTDDVEGVIIHGNGQKSKS